MNKMNIRTKTHGDKDRQKGQDKDKKIMHAEKNERKKHMHMDKR